MNPPEATLSTAINRVRQHKHQGPIETFLPETRLREECGFDSMDLAELTVIIENESGVDIFRSSPVRTFGEALEKISKGQTPTT